MRHFIRFYLLKILLILIVVEIGILIYFQKRNHKPVVVNDVFTSYSGKEVGVNVLKNDVDEDEDSLFIVSFERSEHAQITKKGNKLVFKIGNNYTGTDSIKYLVGDGKKEQEGYVKYIIAENKPPISNNDYITAYIGEKEIEVYVLMNDEDAEDDAISVKSFTQPLFGKVLEDDVLKYIPKKGFSGVDSFKYIITDQLHTSKEATVVVDIKNGIYSPVTYFGNFANFKRLSNSRWEIAKDNNNSRIYLKEKALGSSGLLGEWCIAKNRKYTGDITITFKARTTEDLNNNRWPDYAVIFSFQDKDNYSYAFINKNPNSTGIFNCVDGEKEEIIKYDKPAFEDDKYQAIKIRRINNKATLYIDGKEILTAENEKFGLPGLVGLGSANDKAFFDDFI